MGCGVSRLQQQDEKHDNCFMVRRVGKLIRRPISGTRRQKRLRYIQLFFFFPLNNWERNQTEKCKGQIISSLSFQNWEITLRNADSIWRLKQQVIITHIAYRRCFSNFCLLEEQVLNNLKNFHVFWLDLNDSGNMTTTQLASTEIKTKRIYCRRTVYL